MRVFLLDVLVEQHVRGSVMPGTRCTTAAAAAGTPGRAVCTDVRSTDVPGMHEHAEHETRHKALVLLPVVLL